MYGTMTVALTSTTIKLTIITKRRLRGALLDQFVCFTMYGSLLDCRKPVLNALLQDMYESENTEPRWALNQMHFGNLYLLELHHVSQGSWQPVICYTT
jgi:hypothetical protein